MTRNRVNFFQTKTLCLEVLEGLPVGVVLGGLFDVVREVGEEVQSCSEFNVVYAGHVIGVLAVVVLLVLEEEADRACARYIAGGVPIDLQENFPVILGNRAGFRGIALGPDPDRLLRVGDVLSVEQGTGCDIQRVRSAGLRAYRLLEQLPDSAIELVLDLRRAVDGIVRLREHGRIALAVGIRDLVATCVILSSTRGEVFGILRVPVIHVVAVAPDIDLIAVGIVGSKAIAGSRRPVRRVRSTLEGSRI